MFAATAGLVGLNGVARAQPQATTLAIGEEGAVKTTKALGEEGGVTQALREQGMTQARIPSESGVARPAPQSVDLSDKQMEDAWIGLGSADAAKATVASNTLYTAKKVVPFLKGKLKVDAAAVDEKQVGQLVQDLDADDFATREKASVALAKMGPEAAPALQAAMGKAASLEVRRRLEMVLMKLRESEKVLQVQRGLQILIDIPNKEARDVVEGLSKQTPETWLTQEAKTALQPRAAVPPPPSVDRVIILPPVRIEKPIEKPK